MASKSEKIEKRPVGRPRKTVKLTKKDALKARTAIKNGYGYLQYARDNNFAPAELRARLFEVGVGTLPRGRKPSQVSAPAAVQA
jgi:hypothetical protein